MESLPQDLAISMGPDRGKACQRSARARVGAWSGSAEDAAGAIGGPAGVSAEALHVPRELADSKQRLAPAEQSVGAVLA